MIDDIKAQLKRDEGCKLAPYTDTTGKLTIGVGRNLTDVGISLYEADVLLEDDIRRITAQLQIELANWFSLLSYRRQIVLVNMAFNMGVGGLLTFHKFLAAMQAKDWQTASTEMLSSTWAKQVGDRAQRLSRQIITDTLQ